MFPYLWCGKSFCIDEPIVILELGGNKNLQQQFTTRTTRICGVVLRSSVIFIVSPPLMWQVFLYQWANCYFGIRRQQEFTARRITARTYNKNLFFIHQLLSAAFLCKKKKKVLSKAKAMGFKSKLMKCSLKIWKQLEQGVITYFLRRFLLRIGHNNSHVIPFFDVAEIDF